MRKKITKYFFFMTRGMTLAAWKANGSLDRELAFLYALAERNPETEFFVCTYDADELAIQTPANLKLICQGVKRDGPFSRLLATFYIGFHAAQRCDKFDNVVYRSNQIDGSWSVIIASVFFSGRRILRCGYVKSVFEWRKRNYIRSVIWGLYERMSALFFNKIIVASPSDVKRFSLAGVGNDKVFVNPNYIISPARPIKKEVFDRLLFVGRLREQKNLFSLIKAVKRAEIGLDIVGEGPCEKDLKELATDIGADVNFYPSLDYGALSRIYYRRYQYFVLCSHFEGTPKTLLEALAHRCYPLVSESAIQGLSGFESSAVIIDPPSVTAIENGIRNLLGGEINDSGIDVLLRPFLLSGFVGREEDLCLK